MKSKTNLSKTNLSKTKLNKHDDLQYKVIASGSNGNSVLIGDVLVDCGISFKKVKPYMKYVKYLIITHIHSDHLKLNTYNKIRQLYPHIVCIGNWEVAQNVVVDIISQNGKPVEHKGRAFVGIEVPHDVTTYAYTWEIDGGRVLYCTDASDITPVAEYLNGDKINYFFLESNHDEKKVELIREDAYAKYGYDAYSGAKRHLSTQVAKTFYYMNRVNRDSLWVELHKSSRFY